jgi:hypothetical protein
MSRWAYSMARFTVRELSRMRRGAYPYNRTIEAERGPDRATGTGVGRSVLTAIALFLLVVFLCAVYVGWIEGRYYE